MLSPSLFVQISTHINSYLQVVGVILCLLEFCANPIPTESKSLPINRMGGHTLQFCSNPQTNSVPIYRGGGGVILQLYICSNSKPAGFIFMARVRSYSVSISTLSNPTNSTYLYELGVILSPSPFCSNHKQAQTNAIPGNREGEGHLHVCSIPKPNHFLFIRGWGHTMSSSPLFLI